MYVPHEPEVTAWQVPAPSQVRAGVSVPALHAPPAQMVPAADSPQAPAPLHMPVRPQLEAASAAHSLSGSVPAAMAAQVPLGLPRLGLRAGHAAVGAGRVAADPVDAETGRAIAGRGAGGARRLRSHATPLMQLLPRCSPCRWCRCSCRKPPRRRRGCRACRPPSGRCRSRRRSGPAYASRRCRIQLRRWSLRSTCGRPPRRRRGRPCRRCRPPGGHSLSGSVAPLMGGRDHRPGPSSRSRRPCRRREQAASQQTPSTQKPVPHSSRCRCRRPPCAFSPIHAAEPEQ